MRLAFVGGALLVGTVLFGAACTGTSDVPPPREPEPTLTAPHEAEKRKQHLGTIVIESSPAALVALLNGKSVGNTPITVDDLPAGNYDVTFKDEANGDVTMTVELGEGEYRTVRHNVVPRADR